MMTMMMKLLDWTAYQTFEAHQNIYYR